jgi:hypothetical protein
VRTGAVDATRVLRATGVPATLHATGTLFPELSRNPPVLYCLLEIGEVGSLVAQGLSNGRIAEEMCMSIRTVEGRLYRASHP